MKSIRIAGKNANCLECPIGNLCLAATLTNNEISLLDSIVEHPKALQKSETLFYAGEELENIYAIRSGSIKTFSITQDGEEQITGFHHAGEMIGIDALATNRHKSFAKAMETTEVCAIPYAALDELAMNVPKIHHQLMTVMSNEIARQYDLMLTLNQRSADQRMAAFLVNLHIQSLEYQSKPEVNLNMTRAELGNYLGLALETVSRIISRFKNQGLIKLDRKKVNILDFKKLAAMAGLYLEDSDLKKLAA